jgi:hypothetical protein
MGWVYVHIYVDVLVYRADFRHHAGLIVGIRFQVMLLQVLMPAENVGFFGPVAVRGWAEFRVEYCFLSGGRQAPKTNRSNRSYGA